MATTITRQPRARDKLFNSISLVLPIEATTPGVSSSVVVCEDSVCCWCAAAGFVDNSFGRFRFLRFFRSKPIARPPEIPPTAPQASQNHFGRSIGQASKCHGNVTAKNDRPIRHQLNFKFQISWRMRRGSKLGMCARCTSLHMAKTGVQVHMLSFVEYVYIVCIILCLRAWMCLLA